MVKKLWWHTTFGEIEVYEQEFRVTGQRFRPFSDLANVHCRGCSITLQRVITDFGADHAFGLVPKKLQEHYGIGLSASTVRAITEHHAGQIYQAQELIIDQPQADGCKILIGEIDGSMIPIVKIDIALEKILNPQSSKATHPGATINTDEWGSYNHLADNDRLHVTVCHAPSKRVWAKDEDGDDIREVHVNTSEGFWTGLRNFLRPFRGVNKVYMQ